MKLMAQEIAQLRGGMDGLLKRLAIVEGNTTKEERKTNDVSIRPYEAVFTHKNEKKKPKTSVVISPNGKKISTKGNGRKCGFNSYWALVTCSIPIKNGSISSFKIKIIDVRHFNSIGIVEKYDGEAYMMYRDDKCSLGYYYSGEYGKIGWCEGGNNNRFLQDGLTKWGKGDLICVEVDCIRWTITFKLNGRVVAKAHSILERIAYFPAIQMCQCEGNHFQVVD